MVSVDGTIANTMTIKLGLPLYNRYGNACFFYGQTSVNRGTANLLCSIDGAQLASIASEEERVFIDELQKSSGLKLWDAWVGASDVGLSKNGGSSFAWDDGTSFTAADRMWAPGEPNGDTTENCVATKRRPSLDLRKLPCPSFRTHTQA